MATKPSSELPAHPPIISLANYAEKKLEIRDQLMEAATTTGFFYIRDHGLPEELIERVWDVNAKYFDQPKEAKQALPQLDWNTQHLLGYEVNTTTDGGLLREAHIMKHDHHPAVANAWPDEGLVPGFKQTTRDFMKAVPPIADKILSCFALGLGWPEDYFRETTDATHPENHTVIQCNKYPPIENLKWKEGTNRITAHTDETLITLLLTSPGSAGLELAAGKDGKAVDSYQGHYEVEKWHPCPHLPGCITVNVGDSLQLWSDGILKSNYHRVRMPAPGEPQGVRYSLGYFVWPRDNDVMQNPEGNKELPAMTHAKFMEQKSKGYAAGFHRDPKIYEAAQKIAFGLPTVTAAAG